MKDQKNMGETLDEKGFVFIGSDDLPYLCRMWGDNPWLFYWHIENRWVSLRQINQAQIWQIDKNLTQYEQDIYNNLHEQNS